MQKQVVEQELLIDMFLTELQQNTGLVCITESFDLDGPGPAPKVDAENSEVRLPAESLVVPKQSSASSSDPPPAQAEMGSKYHKHSTTSMHRLLQAGRVPAHGVMQDRHVFARLIKDPRFDMLVGVVIVLNIVVMAAQLEYDGWVISPALVQQPPNRYAPFEDFFSVTEQFFTAFFALELAARLLAQGCAYLGSTGKFADALIVVVCSLDSWILTPVGETGASNLVLLRLLRLIRLSKVFRVIRVMRVFGSLRVLVKAITSSIGALFWSMCLLFVVELSASLLLARLLHPVIQDETVDQEVREFIFNRFGTCARAFLTMFELTMAPGGFTLYRRLFDDVGLWVMVLIVFYVCVVTFAIIRVITAMFLRATLAADRNDSEEQAHEDYVRLLESTTCHHHEPGDGNVPHDADAHTKAETVEKEDLKLLLALPRMQRWLVHGDLTDSDAHWLYDAMWDDSPKGVSLAQYLKALMKMRGPARASDSAVQLQETRQLRRRVGLIEDALLGPPRSRRSHDTQGLVGRASTK